MKQLPKIGTNSDQTGMKCLHETGLSSVRVYMVLDRQILKNPTCIGVSITCRLGVVQPLLRHSKQKHQTGLNSVRVYMVARSDF